MIFQLHSAASFYRLQQKNPFPVNQEKGILAESKILDQNLLLDGLSDQSAIFNYIGLGSLLD